MDEHWRQREGNKQRVYGKIVLGALEEGRRSVCRRDSKGREAALGTVGPMRLKGDEGQTRQA